MYFILLPFDPVRSYFIFWLHLAACRILIPQPGTEPVPLVPSPNHWAIREVPHILHIL